MVPNQLLIFKKIRNSLRAKITIGVILPLVIILVVFASIEYSRQQEVILSQLTSSASRSVRLIENSLRHEMLESDFSEIQTVLETINDAEDFRVVYLLNTNGEIIFSSNQVDVGIQLDNTEPGCKQCHSLDPSVRPVSVIVTAIDGQRVFRSMYPIMNSTECSECHDPSQKIIGLLLTDIPVAPMEQSLEMGFRESLYLWIGVILLTALIVSFSINYLVVRRLYGLASALKRFGKGDRDIRFENNDSDEISQLGQSFNLMGQQIEIEEIENQKLSDQLKTQNIQRGELLKGLITAQEDERKLVARELHDDLGQALSALSLQVQLLEKSNGLNSDEAEEQLNQINNLISETTERMYDLIFALRPSVLDEFGLVVALRNHAERFLENSGITFKLIASKFSGRLSSDLETALFRVFQEALSNVCKHAQASAVIITLEYENGVFSGEIEDDGIGFDPTSLERNVYDKRGLGMLSIKERITQYGGQVEISSQTGERTTISIKVSTTETYHD